MADQGDVRRRRARQRQPVQPLAGPDPEPPHLPHVPGRRGRGGPVLPGASDGRRRHGALAGLAAALHPQRLPAAVRGRGAAGNDAGRLADQLPGARAVLRPGRVGLRRVRPGRGEPLRGATYARLPVPPDAAVPLRPEVPPRVREARVELLPDPAGGPLAAVQRPQGHRHQRLRAAARRPYRHPLERAQRLHPGRGRHWPLRAAGRELRARARPRRARQDPGGGLRGRRGNASSSRRRTSSCSPAELSRPLA